MPGPNATEMAVHIGFVHAGWPGLIAGGVAFIVPAFLISLVLAVIYVRFGTLPQGAALRFAYGINPAVMAIVLTATYRLGQTALKDKRAIVLSVACLVAALLGVNEVVVLLAAGVDGAVGHPDGLADPERHRADGGTGYHIHAKWHPYAAFGLNVGEKERDVQVLEQVRAQVSPLAGAAIRGLDSHSSAGAEHIGWRCCAAGTADSHADHGAHRPVSVYLAVVGKVAQT